MTPRKCSHLWQGEALVDGRLMGQARLSYEKHTSACADCQRELAQLADLHSVMAHYAPEGQTTPFKRQMRRTLLLRTANERLVGCRRAAHGRLATMWGVVLITLLLAVGARTLWRQRASGLPPGPPVLTGRPNYEVLPIAQASYKDQSEGATGRIVIEWGTLAVHVGHLAAGQRFLMTLPDGELEVHGTRFTVEVAEHRTERVEVTEGVVSLRFPGQPEQRLMAGQRWIAVRLSNTPPTPSAPPPASADVTAVVSHTMRASEPPPALTHGASRATATFDGAVRAFDARSFDRAESLFGLFVRDFPGDPRSEDASFLRAVARSRGGDRAGAVSLAREYLTRFPQGLRRQEAERLILSEDAGATGGSPVP